MSARPCANLADEDRTVALVDDAVRAVLDEVSGPLLLAVSGGIDSMVLLESAARVARRRIAAVASFDHGTGTHARAAVRHVRRRVTELGLTMLTRTASGAGRTEAGWREGRWRFLREQAAALRARVVTGHTRDDQLETVLMRILRGSGARGLAGLYAGSEVIRPLLAVSRSTVERYAVACGVRHIEDPTNRSPRHLRNRLRHDLLPALRTVRPELDAELLSVAREAAAWRAQMETLATAVPATVLDGGGLRIATADVSGYSPEALAVLWPAVAARGGITLDRRGTERLAEFTRRGWSGARIQLAGGWEVVRAAAWLELRRSRRVQVPGAPVGLAGEIRFGQWVFRPLQWTDDASPWCAALPAEVRLTVRAWRAGDRMTAMGSSAPRRVKRFFRDAGIGRADRLGWPVVLAADEIVWIPGVRRSDAATARPGTPARVYLCERDHR